MHAVKPFLTYEAQIEKIRSRGCLIADSDAAKIALATMSYYRLSAFFLPFKQTDGNYKQGQTSIKMTFSWGISDSRAIGKRHCKYNDR